MLINPCGDDAFSSASDRQKSFILALSGTSHAIKRTYARAEAVLSERAVGIESSRYEYGNYPLELQFDLIADAWSIIDMAHRFRQCLTSMPGLRVGQRVSEFKSYLSRTEKFRHHFQHFSTFQHSSKSESVWGGLGWWLSLEDEKFPFAKGEGFVMPLPPGEAITVLQLDEEKYYRPSSRVANFTLAMVVDSKPVNLTYIALELAALEKELEDSFRNLRPDKLSS